MFKLHELRMDSKEVLEALQQLGGMDPESVTTAKVNLRGSIEERGLALNTAVLQATNIVVEVV